MVKEEVFPLTMAPSEREVIIVSITGGRGLRSRLMDMGLSKGMKLKILQIHPKGPCIIRAGHMRLVLGHGMAQKILVKNE